MYKQLLQDKIIRKALQKQGVKGYQFDKFKLYNPDTYDKMITQARHSVDVAVREYKSIIQASNKRY